MHISTKGETIHFSGKYASTNNLNARVAQGQNLWSSDLIPWLRRLYSLT